MDFILPLDISQGAMLRGNEYGWSVSSFPDALARAEAHGYACLNGQFQFRLEEATCEMYWLEANSKERVQGESWVDYCHRSCSEVLSGFRRLVSAPDCMKEAAPNRPSVQIDPSKSLVFVAYFVPESDLNTTRVR